MKGDAAKTGPLLRFLKVLIFVAGCSLGAGLVLYLMSPDSAVTGVLLHGGVIALMATPAVRLLAAVAGWVRRRDFAFVALAALVVLELALTLWLAEHIHP